MPYRNADGFTDFESLELLNTEAIEVYKGGNALRYGGSTLGGAINLETKTGYTAARSRCRRRAAASASSRHRLSSGATVGKLDYYGELRAHLARWLPRLRRAGSRPRQRPPGLRLSSDNTDVRAFYFFARVSEQLPGALTRAELASDSHRCPIRRTRPTVGDATTTCITSGCSSAPSSAPASGWRSALTSSTATSITRSSR